MLGSTVLHSPEKSPRFPLLRRSCLLPTELQSPFGLLPRRDRSSRCPAKVWTSGSTSKTAFPPPRAPTSGRPRSSAARRREISRRPDNSSPATRANQKTALSHEGAKNRVGNGERKVGPLLLAGASCSRGRICDTDLLPRYVLEHGNHRRVIKVPFALRLCRPVEFFDDGCGRHRHVVGVGVLKRQR